MGIVLGKVDTGDNADFRSGAASELPALPLPVPGAVPLTPQQMNQLHFGGRHTTPLPPR